MRNAATYGMALLRALMRDTRRGAKAALFFAVMMFFNNIIYFALWAVYFRNFASLNGWTLKDFAVLQGICSMGFGLAFFFFGGAWTIGRKIFSGELDSFLGRPRDPLLPLLMSECRASTLGDIASAFPLWLWFGGCGLGDLPLLMALSLAAGMLFLAVIIAVQSLAFWASETTSIADSLFEVFLTLAMYPQNVHGPLLSLLLFTVVPAAYIGLLPVEIMRDFSWPQLALVAAAAVLYLALAIFIFRRGLRHYSSGNLLQR